ncbi:MAG: PIN/TRAM domain-containing protein [Planctomycetaceae bacterium]|nr:PIN/TRAM domain-containing protein [Planctomycetaceae bacterium]
MVLPEHLRKLWASVGPKVSSPLGSLRSRPSVSLLLLRAIFILVSAGLGARLARIVCEDALANPYLVFVGLMIAAIIVVLGDLLTPQKRIQTVSALYFGLIVGIILSNLINDALQPAMQLYFGPKIHLGISSLFMVFACYICISTLLQTKDDFRFIIPYIEFSKEVKGARPLVLDTSVVIDGRIADVAETRIIDQPMVVPRFVLQELQSIADSSDKLRRNRGRRGLDILNRLQKSQGIEVRVHDAEISELAGVREVDQRLVILAKHLGGKVVTNDYNLNKIARLQGVEVINLNDLANAMKPIVLPGENLTVKLIKKGEEPGQGVGYLDDGTMVVAEQGSFHLGESVRLTVTSVLQTSAGRMIFGRMDQVLVGKSGNHVTAPAQQESPSPTSGRTPNH